MGLGTRGKLFDSKSECCFQCIEITCKVFSLVTNFWQQMYVDPVKEKGGGIKASGAWWMIFCKHVFRWKPN